MDTERATLLAMYLEDCARELLVLAASARGYAGGTVAELQRPNGNASITCGFAWAIAYGLSAIPAYQNYLIGKLADELPLPFNSLIKYANALGIR
jgi:hypothetical protein